MSFTLAIVGRPNVGKSTLFNRLVGKRHALVDDRPGVTRDLREGDARLGDLRFSVIDTAGLEGVSDDSLPGRMQQLTERAIDLADICLFVTDARSGITFTDRMLADLLRRRNASVVLAANKAESASADAGVLESYSLGMGDPVRLSAAHGEGMSELYDRLRPVADASPRSAQADAPATDVFLDRDTAAGDTEDLEPGIPLRLAVVGRPNAGKSTLVNRVFGEDRLLTGPEPGLTRDAISLHTVWNGVPVRICDTAGMRKKAKVQDRLEKMSVGDGLRAVQFAEVVVMLLDSAIPFEQQDLRIADYAAREGRAVVFAANKWDLESGKRQKLIELKEALDRLLPQLHGASLVTVSARTGSGLDRLQEAVLGAYRTWNRRVATAQLNQWLAGMVERHPPPASQGIRPKLRYITQAKTRPPGFVVMCNRPEKIPESYRRYLINGLREDFAMSGTPIRMTMRSQSDRNPYKGRRKPNSGSLRKHLAKP